MVPGEDSWFSLPDINCASILVSMTFDQSDGDRGYAGARNGEGFSSSSLALTTLDSFEGRRDNSLFSSPVIWFRRKKGRQFRGGRILRQKLQDSTEEIQKDLTFIATVQAFLSLGPIRPPSIETGSNTSSRVHPDINDA